MGAPFPDNTRYSIKIIEPINILPQERTSGEILLINFFASIYSSAQRTVAPSINIMEISKTRDFGQKSAKLPIIKTINAPSWIFVSFSFNIGIANIATQIKRVLFQKAAPGAGEIERPLKKRIKGTEPPIRAIKTNLPHPLKFNSLNFLRYPIPKNIDESKSAAMIFFSVV